MSVESIQESMKTMTPARYAPVPRRKARLTGRARPWVLPCLGLGLCLLFTTLSPAAAQTTEPGETPASSPGDTGSAPDAAGPTTAGALNVRTFGAKGDGISNDRPALQAAVDAAPQGATLYFPAGTYRLDAPVRVSKGHLTLTGDGSASILHHGNVGALDLGAANRTEGLVVTRLKFLGLPGKYGADGNSARALVLNGTRGAVIRDCDFEGPGVAVINNTGVTFGTQILDCRVKGWGEFGFICNGGERITNCSLVQDDPDVKGQRSSQAIYTQAGARDVAIADCLIANVRHIGVRIDLHGSESEFVGLQFARNTIRNCQDGIVVDASARDPMLRNLVIEGNRFEDMQFTAVRLAVGNQVSLRNNTFVRCADGIRMRADGASPLERPALQDVTIENNAFSGCNAIILTAANGASVSSINLRGNTMTECPSSFVVQGVDSLYFTIWP
jgi:hypothetical protein